MSESSDGEREYPAENPSGAATTLPRIFNNVDGTTSAGIKSSGGNNGGDRVESSENDDYQYEERYLDDGQASDDAGADYIGNDSAHAYSSSSGTDDSGYPPDFIMVEAHRNKTYNDNVALKTLIEEDGVEIVERDKNSIYQSAAGESKTSDSLTEIINDDRALERSQSISTTQNHISSEGDGRGRTMKSTQKIDQKSDLMERKNKHSSRKKMSEKNKKKAKKKTEAKKKKNKKKKGSKKRTRSKSRDRRRKRSKSTKSGKQRNRKRTSNTSSAEWRFENEAYAAAQRWTAYDDACIHSDSEEPPQTLTLDFAAGPIGVTFAWQNGLVVMAVPGLVAASKGGLSPAFPPLGARLSMIEGESVVGVNFSATVSQLEAAQRRPRSLGFHVLPPLRNSKAGSLHSKESSGCETDGNVKGSNATADILKLPSISRPSSSSMLGGDRSQHSEIDPQSTRPLSAGMSVENPEVHERELAKASESRKRGAWEDTSKDTKAPASQKSKGKGKTKKTKPKGSQSSEADSSTSKKKKKKKKGKEKKAEEHEEKFVGDPFVGPIQKKIEARLKREFDAVHVSVVNRTYFYRNRAFLGQKRFNLREAKQNKASMQWEARIWTLEFDDSTGKAKASKTWLGQTSKRSSALRLCEHGAEKRDRGEFEPIPIEPGKPDEFDFDILVVSKLFEHQEMYYRLQQVYEAILSEIYEHVDPYETNVAVPAFRPRRKIEDVEDSKLKDDFDERHDHVEEARGSSPESNRKKRKKAKHTSRGKLRPESKQPSGSHSKTKVLLSPAQKKALAERELRVQEEKQQRVSSRVGYGTIGVNVTNNLPHFRFFHPDRPRRFSILAKTPSQWDPSRFDPALSERFGGAHLDPTALGLEPHTKAGQKDMKMLELPPPPDLSEDATDEERMHQKGGPPLFPDVKGKRKAGTRIGHFFFGLSKKTKEMMDTHRKDLAKKAAKAALAEADEAHRQEELKRRAAAKKSGGVSGFAAIVAGNAGNKKTATDLFRETMRRQIRAARMLQRIYIRNRVPKIVRKNIQRHRAATNIGRSYRGYKGRLYYKELLRIKTKAAVSIEATYRMMIGARMAAEFRRVRTEAALRIQPVVRGWFGRQFAAWKRENDKLGTTMNKVVRGYLARCKFKRMLAAHFHRTVVVPSVIMIQCMTRSAVARSLLKKLKHEKWIREVAIPASILIQKRARGMIVRERFRIEALRQRSALLLQTQVRGWSCRMEYPRIKLRALKLKKVVVMQCFARKCFARTITQKRRELRYHLRVRIPATIKVQGRFRTHRARRRVREFRRKTQAALKLQCFWRGIVGRRLMLVRWEEMRRAYRDRLATRLQSEYRAYVARKKFYLIRQVWIAQRIAAAIVIQAGWRGYVGKQRVVIKTLRRKAERVWTDLAWCEDEDKAIREDMEDVTEEIRVARKRKKHAETHVSEIKEMRREWKTRLAVVENELDEMTEEDVEHGWGEAFENEYAQLTEQLPMSAEDQLNYQLILDEQNEKLYGFDLEWDELEMDQEELVFREIDNLENIRHLEIQKCEERCRKDMEARVRKQKNKWKIKSKREKRMKLHGLSRQGLAEHVSMPYDETQTLETNKRARFKRLHKQRREQRTVEMRRKQNEETRLNGEGNKKIRMAYDEVVNGVKKLLGEFSYDMRLEKSDIRSKGDTSAFCDECGRIVCQCGVVPEMGEDGEEPWVESDDDGW